MEEIMGTCPVCRKFLLAKDFEHVLDLVGSHSSQLVYHLTRHLIILFVVYIMPPIYMIDILDGFKIHTEKRKEKKKKLLCPIIVGLSSSRRIKIINLAPLVLSYGIKASGIWIKWLLRTL
jgi:hypothetical protein